jgi:hypothetical protein
LADADRFRIHYSQNYIDAKHKSPASFWLYLQDDFPYMTRLAKAVMVLPQSLVSIERVFGHLKNFKAVKRNRLNAENLEASLLLFQKYGEGSFEVSTEMLKSLKRS